MAKLSILLEAKDKASAKLKAFGAQVKGAEKKTGKLATKLGKLKDGMGSMQAAAAAAGVLGVLKLTGDLVKLGVEAERGMRALEGMTGSSKAAEEALVAVQEASGGALSRMDAAQNATRLFSMGLANTAQEAADLTKIAITLGATMGKGPTEAFEEFTLLLANQSILRLDTFGISGAAVRETMKGLKAETEGMTRETAFMTAVTDEAAIKMAALDEANFEAISSLDKMGAMWKDAKTNVATFLADGLLPIIDGFMDLKTALSDHQEVLVAQVDNYEDYWDILGPMERAMGALTEAEFIAARSAYEHTTAVKEAGAWTQQYADAVRATGEAADISSTKIKGLTTATGDLTKASLGATAMRNLDSALNEGNITQEEYDLAARQVMGTLLEMPQSMIDAQQALSNINQDFATGRDTASEYVGNIMGLGREIGELPEYKEIEISIKVTGDQVPEFQHGGSFTVPPGFENDGFLMRVGTGEKVNVQPASVNNSRAVNISNVNINSGMDERGFKRMLGRALS